MFVSLPMYDLPELAAATDTWWSGLRRHLAAQGFADLPAKLMRTAEPIEHCLRDRPIFTQTCGYPLTHALDGHARLLATPRYRAPGCAGATYVSWVVVRADADCQSFADLRGRRVAYNGRDSQSGYNVLRALAAPLAENGRFFGSAVESGAHRRSLAMVKADGADVATIDCVSFALIARAAPEEVEGIRVLCASATAPSLPYVTAAAVGDAEIARMQAAMFAACADRQLAEARAALLLDGFEIVPRSRYDVILDMERAALDRGYPDVA